MRHVRTISLVRADSVSDFTNTLYVAFKDLLYAQGLGFLDSFDFLSGEVDFDNLLSGKNRQ